MLFWYFKKRFLQKWYILLEGYQTLSLVFSWQLVWRPVLIGLNWRVEGKHYGEKYFSLILMKLPPQRKLHGYSDKAVEYRKHNIMLSGCSFIPCSAVLCICTHTLVHTGSLLFDWHCLVFPDIAIASMHLVCKCKMI